MKQGLLTERLSQFGNADWKSDFEEFGFFSSGDCLRNSAQLPNASEHPAFEKTRPRPPPSPHVPVVIKMKSKLSGENQLYRFPF